MELICTGAEAVIFKTTFLGMQAVKKIRVEKKYREKKFDTNIRTKRTKQECVLMHKAKKALVRCPVIYKIDKKNCGITMEFLNGKKVRDLLSKKNFGAVCKKIGLEIGKLHSAGIIHGDLTTGNMILNNGEIAFVDFGLGFVSGKTEDRASDLLSLKKTFLSTHFSLKGGFEKILLGYKKNFSGSGTVIGKISEIEARTRYS